MTIILPYNSDVITTFFLFLKEVPNDNTQFSIKVYKNKTLITENLFNNNVSSSTDRYVSFSVSTEVETDEPDVQDNFYIDDEGWYDFKLFDTSDTPVEVDEGQLFIGDYNASETEKIFYEK